MHAMDTCLANPSPENIGLSLEVLYTLKTMVELIHTSKLILFPQLFWGTVSLLYSDYEIHFAEAVKLLSKLVDRFNFSDRAVQNVLLASIPKAWDTTPFAGVQPLVLRGLLSPVTEPDTVELLSKFTLLMTHSEIFHLDDSRIVANMVGLLPWLVLNVDAWKRDRGMCCLWKYKNEHARKSALLFIVYAINPHKILRPEKIRL